ncbi:Gmad2 immunoglobulin-like domain-containing protein [Nocardioides sp.]|uniref:Gmad2 immunoglobulin-like domain-containing protein n=1 Tax=Nocardioides sp. TaxID=35761 RepID=UPI0035113548
MASPAPRSAPPARRLPRPGRALLPAAWAAALLGLLLVLSGCEASGDPTPAASPSSSASTSADGDDGTGGRTGGGAGGSAASSTATDGPGTVTAVYLVGDTPRGERLYPELHRIPGDDRLVGAADLLAAPASRRSPGDPDYRSLWPTGRFASVELRDGAFVVGLADDTWTQAAGLTPGQASLAVQQLVYTLRSAAGPAGRGLPVRAEVDGRPVTTLLGVTVGPGLGSEPELDVLALASITAPAEGAQVDDVFTASGRASSFEATVPWRIEDDAGAVLLTGYSNAAGWVDRLYPWTTRIDVSSLRPGRYRLVVATDDPSSGEGGGPDVDTRTIVVR